MYACSWFPSMNSRDQHNIVKQLYSTKIQYKVIESSRRIFCSEKAKCEEWEPHGISVETEKYVTWLFFFSLFLLLLLILKWKQLSLNFWACFFLKSKFDLLVPETSIKQKYSWPFYTTRVWTYTWIFFQQVYSPWSEIGWICRCRTTLVEGQL